MGETHSYTHVSIVPIYDSSFCRVKDVRCNSYDEEW